jgi:puromycin-sensitive aminopeptidase
MFRRLAATGVRSAITSAILAVSLVPGAVAGGKNSSKCATIPAGVVPISYQIFVEPHPEDGKFVGSESIDMQVKQPISKIVLNSVDIKLNHAECKLVGSTNPITLKVHYQPDVEQVVLELPRRIESGRCILSMKFHGTLDDKGKGFFRTISLDAAGGKHWISATQMEPTDARRMFPCIDEPQYKATFKVSASIAPGDTAISNSPILAETTDAKTKRKIVTFDETPKMSTYLVALIVGRLVPTKTIISEGVPIRIWCTPGKEKLTPFSQALAGRLLKYYTEYFAVKYPAKKLDLIAIPDFANGAMENLGAATFREDTLLVDESQGSLDAKQQVAINVAHEMAHMWFGDLVTMQWWDDLWLNEAFAEWMSTKAVDKLQPDWHYWNQFALERDQSMLSDSLRATRPMHLDVTNADQIEQMFDEITYQKGASVLRMMERFVTEDKFRDGIRRYIKSNQFANATPDSLWRAIAAESGKDISGIMHSWIYDEGFPLVSINSSEPQLTVSQKRFVFKRSQQGSDSAPIWQIPLEVRRLEDDGDSAQKFLVTDKDTKLAEIGAAPCVVNAGGEGYYRVQYSANELSKIASHLDKLTVLERAAALSDQFYLAVSGQIPVKDYLDFTAAYKGENDPTVTSLLCTELNQLDLMIDDSPSERSAFADYVRDRLSKAKQSFGWSSLGEDSDLIRRERAEVMLTLGTIGQDKNTIAEARALAERIYAHDTDTGTTVDAELIDPIIKIVAYNGNAADYAKIETLWHRAKSPEREQSALMALAMFQDPVLMQKTLKMCLTDQVRRQDGPQLIAAIMETRAGRSVAWHFFHKHIIHIAWRFSGTRLFSVVMAMNSLATKEQLAEVQGFFKKHPVPSQSRGINKIIEAIEVRVAFRQRSGNQLCSWLEANALPDRTIQITQRNSTAR